MMSFWRRWMAEFNPLERVAAKTAVWVVSLFVIAMFSEDAAYLFLIATFVYLVLKVVAWGFRQDEKERSARNFHRGFLNELRDIERRVLGESPAPERPDKPGLGLRAKKDSMPCIWCGAPANRGGRYCDSHDD